MNAQPDWVEYHREYPDPGFLLSARGEVVKGHLRAELDDVPAGDSGWSACAPGRPGT